MPGRTIRILETAQEMVAVEQLQRLVWPGDDTEIVPLHLLVTAAHNGGLVIGAYDEVSQEGDTGPLVGFVFGFPGLYFTPDGPRPKHCSHMLAVHPGYRDRGIGFALKRAQWQMVRHQQLDLITWTYDPLQSRNAYLNIAKLGAVCNRYRREVYGEMRDGLNVGMPSDRFEVDWWVNTKRVERRLSRRARRQLDLAHFLSAEAAIINPTRTGSNGLPLPADSEAVIAGLKTKMDAKREKDDVFLLVEIPADIQQIKAVDTGLALAWRAHTRDLFEFSFSRGYLVTDTVYLPGPQPRSFYVLSHGESTL